jgi:hypothetical protein
MADDETVSLTPTEFIVLYWLARRRLVGEPGVNWSTREAVEEFFAAVRRIMNPAGGDYERLERAFQGRMDDPKALGEYFKPHKSRINKAFIKALGEYAAYRYLIHRVGPPGASHYGLALDAEAIEIRE